MEAADDDDIIDSHGIEEHTVDLGEIRMNLATRGDPSLPALLIVPAVVGAGKGICLLADRYQVFAVDLRRKGQSTCTTRPIHARRLGRRVRSQFVV